MTISEFLVETKKQYIDLLISSRIAAASDRATIEAKLKDFQHGNFSDQLGSAKAEIKVEGVDDHKEAVLYANRNLIATLENTTNVNDPALDELRQTIFHETTHVLQQNEQMDEYVGYLTPQREGYGANEAAAEMAEQLLMVEYLKKVRGLENAGLRNVTARENGLEFQAVEVTPDTFAHDSNQNVRAGSYFREVSVTRDALRKMGARETDFIRNSFGFKTQERETFAAEFSQKVGDFNQFNTDLTSMLVFERQNAGENVVSLDEYKEAATRINTAPEQSQPTINEYGEIERTGNEPETIDPSIPTFTPPEPHAQSTPRSENVNKIDLDELRRAKEELAAGANFQAEVEERLQRQRMEEEKREERDRQQ